MQKKTEKKKEINKPDKNSYFGMKEVIGIVIITSIVSFVMGISIKPKDDTKELSRYEKELISNYQYILENYYKNIEARDLVAVAIKGMIASLDDPYADFINSNNVDSFNMIIDGEYEGIGIQISYNENQDLIITYVFPNSSADKTGLKAGDVITSIDGNEVAGKSLEEVKSLITSFNGKEFSLKYKRDNEQNEVSLKTDKIVIESADSKVYEKNDRKIGYIRLNNFATNSYNQFKDKLVDLESKEIESLIIDLRDNSGGKLETVDSIVSLFIKNGDVIYQMKEKNKITKYYSNGKDNRKYPIVVLVNEYSASASELMTSALKEVYNATIIGKRTYGKGTAQKVISLDNGEQYKFTTKEWLTAKGNSIDGLGIEPDIKVVQSDEYYQNPTDENDTQLQQALEFLCK